MSLGQVDQDLFQQALKIVAEKFGGTVEKSIKDYYGKELTEWEGAPIIGAIKTPAVKRGLGFIMKNGKLQCVGDSYGCESQYKALQKEVERTYRALALARALTETSWEISDIETQSTGTIFKVRKP